MKLSRRDIYTIAGLGVSVATSIAGAVNSYIKGKKIAKLEENLEKRGNELFDASEVRIKSIENKLETKIDAISDSVDVDVPDYIVEEALRKAAEKEASIAIVVRQIKRCTVRQIDRSGIAA